MHYTIVQYNLQRKRTQCAKHTVKSECFLSINFVRPRLRTIVSNKQRSILNLRVEVYIFMALQI